MHITFIVKASTDIGYGHLIRSRSLANDINGLLHKEDQIHFYVIGDEQLNNLLTKESYPYSIFSSEKCFLSEISVTDIGNVVIFDLLSVSDELFERTLAAKWHISISPIFSHLNHVDTLFHRSRYYDSDLDNVEIIKGLDYAIIQKGCRQIDAASYKRHLNEKRMSLAVSMGGGDAANKSLMVIEELNNLSQDFTVWVMLGEGYKHSYDALIGASKKSHHEIILAKTNESMWHVLGLSSLLILPGGLTTYEAAYVGLPTLNIVEGRKQHTLVKELLEAGVGAEVDGLIDGSLVEKVSAFNQQRDALFDMHMQSKGLIDGLAGERIYEIILNRRKKLA